MFFLHLLLYSFRWENKEPIEWIAAAAPLFHMKPRNATFPSSFPLHIWKCGPGKGKKKSIYQNLEIRWKHILPCVAIPLGNDPSNFPYLRRKCLLISHLNWIQRNVQQDDPFGNVVSPSKYIAAVIALKDRLGNDKSSGYHPLHFLLRCRPIVWARRNINWHDAISITTPNTRIVTSAYYHLAALTLQQQQLRSSHIRKEEVVSILLFHLVYR